MQVNSEQSQVASCERSEQKRGRGRCERSEQTLKPLLACEVRGGMKGCEFQRRYPVTPLLAKQPLFSLLD